MSARRFAPFSTLRPSGFACRQGLGHPEAEMLTSRLAKPGDVLTSDSLTGWSVLTSLRSRRAEMLFNRDSEHHGRSPSMQRRRFAVLDHAPEGGVFLPQFAPGAVSLDVVGQEYCSISKMGPCDVELAAHVPVGVQAVVDEEVDRADLFEQPGQCPGAGSPMQPPPAFQRFWYGYAPELLVLTTQGRQ